MTTDSKYVAHLVFANRIYRSNDQAFQRLFWAVMKAQHGQDFIEVRAQGRKGDGGNDGYLPGLGHYFQVYGPISPEETVIHAAHKLSDDYQKLKKNWGKTKKIAAYSFVYNDKYEGVFRTIAEALGAIEKSYGIPCRPFTSGDLESQFMVLPEDKMTNILGTLLPDPHRVVGIDYSVLKDAIDRITATPVGAGATRFGDLPQLNDKIALNHLCTAWADILRRGARAAGHVDSYFRKNSTFMKQALRDHLVGVYQNARDEARALRATPAGITREDLTFERFRTALLPAHATRAAEDAVEIIIAYYFEACDVFDPNAKQGAPNASP